MDKRVANADVAIDELRDGATILMGGFGALRHSRKSDRRGAPHGHEESHRRLEQCRHDRISASGLLLADAPDPEDDRQLRRAKTNSSSSRC